MSFGHDIRFRVEEPSSGGLFCFNLRVTTNESMRLFQDVEDDSRWYRRLWHRVARPIRRLRCS